MLTIQNIDKIIGMEYDGRKLINVEHSMNTLRNSAYVFVFESVGNKKGWSSEQRVHLVRDPHDRMDGEWSIFVMGLQLATETRLLKSVIENRARMVDAISLCLSKSKDWWDRTNKTK
jgi:hypothetical protein